MSRVQRPESRVQRPVSRVQRPKSSVQSPASRVQRPESRVQRPEPIVQSPASRVQSPASRVQRSGSSVQSPASRVQRPTLASRVQEFRYALGRKGTYYRLNCKSVVWVYKWSFNVMISKVLFASLLIIAVQHLIQTFLRIRVCCVETYSRSTSF